MDSIQGADPKTGATSPADPGIFWKRSDHEDFRETRNAVFNDQPYWLFWLRARRVFLACAFNFLLLLLPPPPPIFITSICLFPPSCLVSFNIMHPAMVNQVTATFWQEQQLLSLRQVQSRLL